MTKTIDLLKNDFNLSADASIFHGDCLDLLRQIPDQSIQLVVTSPPYNIGKEYERKIRIEDYLQFQEQVISECWRILKPEGSLCWQVGNHVDNGCVYPLDTLLYPVFMKHHFLPRNRIVWHFEHGLHCTNRFSGRYETINWFTKSSKYYFDLDPVRVPQKYPGKKYFKGPKAGQYSCNPKGKNPGDVWIFPNVKNNHVEKTEHPCQFPIELVERLVLSMTEPGDWVLDPFVGSGTSIIAALMNGRRGAGAEMLKSYVDIIEQRIEDYRQGTLKYRARDTPVYDASAAGKSLTTVPWERAPSGKEAKGKPTSSAKQTVILEKSSRVYGK